MMLLRGACTAAAVPCQQVRRLSATRPALAGVLESFWDTIDNMGVTPHGGYHWWESFHTSAVKKIRERLRHVDVVVELRDARVPFSSYNEELEKLTAGKPRVVVFNKADLADPDANRKLIEFYNALGVPVMLTSNQGIKPEDAKKLAAVITRLHIPTFLNEYPIQALVVGMPNVGKSSIIMNLRRAFNDELTAEDGFRLKTRKKMRRQKVRRSVGFIPGVTRKIGAVTVRPSEKNGHITLIDTPGLLMPRTVNIVQAQKIAMVGLSEWQHTVGRDRYVKDVATMIFEVLFRNGLEASVMAHFRMPFPPPQTLGEFQGRAILTMGMLGLNLFKHLKYHSEKSYSQSYHPQRLMVSEMLINEFRKGSFGRVTLDEIPVINEENIVTAPKYIQDLYDAEQERRKERDILLRAARELNKKSREEAKTREEEEAREAEHTTTDEAHRRVWDIKTTTIDLSAGEGKNPSEEQKSYKLNKVVRQLTDSEQTLSRTKGVLAGNLTQFDTTRMFDRDEKNTRFREYSSAKFNMRYMKQKKRSAVNAMPDEIAPKLKKYVRIKSYARSNPLNDMSALNIFTGEKKQQKTDNPAFKEALQRVKMTKFAGMSPNS